MTKNFAVNNKSKFASIALILVLTFAASLVALPIVSAHDPPWTVSTYAFISVAPNPVGVGQTAYVNFWLDKVPPTSIGSWGVRWHNITVTVTKPDGTTQTLGSFDSDAVGGVWTSIVPDQIGTYTFVGNFPGQVVVKDNPYPYPSMFPLGEAFINDTYTGSSATMTLNVQEEPIETAYPANPLPTDYWERPINSMNREWYSIGGNWLGLGASLFSNTGCYDCNLNNFNPYTTAPDSAHVLWTKPLAFGGQIGGEFGEDSRSLYATGTAYEPKFASVILYGILYYTSYPGAANNPGPLTAVDLRTGQTLWTKNLDAPLKVGMIYNFMSGNQYGAHAYLFTAPSRMNSWVASLLPNSWSMYEAMTGEWILDIANASAGTLTTGPNGEILSYTISDGMLTLWNASKCIEEGSRKNNFYVAYSAEEIWRPPQGATIDWDDGYEWSAPMANTISGLPIIPPLSVAKISDDVVFVHVQPGGGALGGVPGGAGLGYQIDAGYSAITGELLWGPINRTLTPYTNVDLGPAGEGVYTEYTQQTMSWSGYSIKTGEKLWGPTEPYNNTWGYYDNEAPIGVIGYGNLYTWSFNGEVHCYDVQTGVEKWYWIAGSAGIDSPYGVWPFPAGAGVLADGKIYVASYHDYTPPVQQPCPAEAEGVEVVITTFDPNGNTYEFGRTTTDTNGAFGCVVDPPVSGKYKIIATFEGSDSYYSSFDTTYIYVGEKSSPAQPIEPEPTPTEPTAEAPFITTTEIAIIAAVAVAVVIGVVAFWALKKRK